MKKIKIAPSILGVPCLETPKVINELISAGADVIHYDVMDGKFVSNTSFPIEEFIYHKNNVDPSVIFDVHLMTYDLVENIKKFANGASYITFHYEAIEDNNIESLISLIKSYNVKAGISICPSTPVEVLNPYLKDLDLVLIMSVVPGKGGQSFMPISLDKISYLDNYRKENNLSYEIEVDGGINEETSKLVKERNVDMLVAGSFIIKSDNYASQINKLK
jgi:ribulose-phosphate 3-epimerase